MRIVGVLGLAFGVLTCACACARRASALAEPPFVEMTGSPVVTTCIAPSAWNCHDAIRGAFTRKDVLEALATADLARAAAPAKQELAPRAARAEEEAALAVLRSYLACYPWDLDLTFELAQRNVERRRFSDATYLFLRVTENDPDDRAVTSFLHALEALNATAMRAEARR